MMQKNILKSVDYESEATKARLHYAVKKYATDGKNIPLKKNWSETWCTLPVSFDKCFEETLNFEVHNDDVFLVTFIKSGTTWMQESAWLLLNNLDFKKAKEISITLRSPYLELQGFIPGCPGPMEMAKDSPRPRLIKSHMPANLLPEIIWTKKQKTIYVARNVKDVIVSSFHFLKNINLYHGNSFAEYVEDFLHDEVMFTPYWSHVISYWHMRHEPFIFFITYEEMQRDLVSVLQRLCCFLERPQLTTEEVEKIIEHLSFDSMKKNKNSNMEYSLKKNLPGVKEDFQFMRRGIVGSFKDELTPELIAKIDKWSAEYLSQHGIKEDDIFGEF